MLTEQHLENLCLDWFRAGGYKYAYGPDISHDGDTPERSDYQQVILTGRLISSMKVSAGQTGRSIGPGAEAGGSVVPGMGLIDQAHLTMPQ